MQTKYGEGIFVSKPKKMRQYLLQQSPYVNGQDRASRLAVLHRSLEREGRQKNVGSQKFKSELIELVESSRGRMQGEGDRQRQR
jgi:hypothetical protein